MASKFSARLVRSFARNYCSASASNVLHPKSVKADHTSKGTPILSVHWSNDKVKTYPAVWLRDNCQCNHCCNNSSRRLFQKVSSDVELSQLQLNETTKQIEVKWSDGHMSKYEPRFLTTFGRYGSSGDIQGFSQRSKPKLWTSDQEILVHQYQDVMNSNDALFNWLHDLSHYGLTLLKGVPTNLDGLPTLARRIAFPEMTHYGLYFKVESKPQTNNLAYTGVPFGLHLDLPYYERTPSTQFLHCVIQTKSEGGGSLFSDAFNVAEKIRREHKTEWEILTKVKIPFSDVGYDEDGGIDFYKVKYWPTIQLDKTGNVIHIAFNNASRARALTLGDDQALDLYKALFLFNELLHSPEFMVTYKMEPGDCASFDNQRVLHGRRSFDLKTGGKRLLHGTYIAWDEIRSKMNSIKFRE